MTTAIATEEVVYRLGKKSNLWMTFTPSGHDGNRTWQLQLSARNRGGAKILASLWETTALKPIGSITFRGETYPLTIGWHRMKRGGTLLIGGERKTGIEGGTLAWELQWKPLDNDGREDIGHCFEAELRLRTTPRRDGRVAIHLYTPLYKPEVISLSAAASRGHCAMVAWSSYHKHAAGFVMLAGVDDEVGWEESQGGFSIAYDGFPFGGGRAIRFAMHFGAAQTPGDARSHMTEHYALVADTCLHPTPVWRLLTPTEAVDRYASVGAFHTVGIERLYPKTPEQPTADAFAMLSALSSDTSTSERHETGSHASSMPSTLTPSPSPSEGRGESEAARGTEAFYAGHPHYPLEMLNALWDWQRLHVHNEIGRLVRFGSTGLSADFQVMGREGLPEPNKGAFWDKMEMGLHTDSAGNPTHGLAANARIARSLFLIHQATCEALFKQSAINISQWLILKHNDAGYYSGERTHATLGQAEDGKLFGDPHSLDGVSSIQPFVLAYQATKNEVYIKAARKIAEYLGEDWLADHDPGPPTTIANVITSLLAFDAEAPSERRRAIIRDWGSALRVRPLDVAAPSANYDGFHGGAFDCAQAALRLHALESDPDFLRYAFAVISAIPEQTHVVAWRAIRVYFDAMLSLTATLPDFSPDFDNIKVRNGWREFCPDQAAESFLKVTAPGGVPVDFIPLVCRANDQMLVIVLAGPDVATVDIRKNGKRPLVKDLITGSVDGDAPLHPLIGESWANAGLFTIDP